ncbi:hypothetical protein F5B17DRAFT_408085 [Nemania serpens]|nr:hypothetical protein F5B17DRAFT_408085 [Nemania serpens]
METSPVLFWIVHTSTTAISAICIATHQAISSSSTLSSPGLLRVILASQPGKHGEHHDQVLFPMNEICLDLFLAATKIVVM